MIYRWRLQRRRIDLELGKSKEDYLKAIFILQLKSSNVHSVNIAQYMGVSKASVSVAMKQF